MHVLPINSYKPNFQSNRRTVLNKNGELLYKTTTYFFRDDFDWRNFINLLKSKYRNTDKVNLIVHACSNGPEVYSCIMKLMTDLGPEAKKFFPIIGKDIDAENIKTAQNGGYMDITNYDQLRINYHTQNRFNEFMSFTRTNNPDYVAALVPKPIIREQAEFHQGDILDDIDNLSPENTVLLCRNFWLYINEDKRKAIADKLTKLAPSSLIGIGHFDNLVGVDQLLLDRGFVQTNVVNVYSKPIYPNYHRF